MAQAAGDLHNLLAKLDVKGVGFRCLAQSGVDTTTSTGKLTLAILGAVPPLRPISVPKDKPRGSPKPRPKASI